MLVVHSVPRYAKVKRLGCVCLLGLYLGNYAEVSYALPQDGKVAGGSAGFTYGTKTLDINQQSDRAVIDWRSFNINPDESTQFHQPGSGSITLNRVNDANPSQVLGKLSANGNLILVNPNGVFFGKDSKVDVNGIIATSSDIKNSNFMAGRLSFDTPGKKDSAIINQGSITAKEAGLVGLVAPSVINDGTITAKLGKVHLASADRYTVDLYGDGLLNLAVSDAVQKQLVANTGSITANGGTIKLTAAAGKDIVNSLIAAGGSLKATSVGSKDGKIILYAEGNNAVKGNHAEQKGVKQGSSTVLVQGVLDASGRDLGEYGGSIKVLGDDIAVLGGTVLDVSGYTGKSDTTAQGKISDARPDAAGGGIMVGGDYLGKGVTPTAKNLYVDPYTLFYADAIHSGDAGRAIFWSDGNTAFGGNVYARALGGKAIDSLTLNASAGGNKGNGGFVETSGPGHLDANGYVDLTASNGSRGTYFLDPTDITIYGNTTSVFNNSGLAGYWNFDEGTGTTANDSSGGNHSGTLVNSPTWSNSVAPTPYANGHSLSFDGSSAIVSAPLTKGATTTFSLWASTTGLTNNYGMLFLAGPDGTGPDPFFYNNKILWNTWDGAGNPFADIPANYNDGNFHHYAFVVEAGSGNTKLYYDGTYLGSANYANPSASTVFNIGGASGYLWKGNIDDVRVYTNALSANDIAELAGTRFTAAGLQAMSATADISLAASHNITLDLSADTLTMSTGRNLTLSAGNQINTASAGNIATNGGNITLAATGGVMLNHSIGLTTNGGNITLSDATVAANQNWSAGSGTITLGTLDGANAVTASAGTFTFNGALGDATPLGAVSLTSANSLILPSITAASLAATTTGGAADIGALNAGTLVASGIAGITINSARDINFSNEALDSSTANGIINLTAVRNAYLTSINSGTGDLMVNANDVFLTYSHIIAPGLVGYYRLDEGSGTLVYDSSPRGNNGTIVGGASYSGSVPSGFLNDTNSLNLNGTNYVPLGGSPITGSNPFTLAAWINTTTLGNYAGAVSVGNSAVGGSAYLGTVPGSTGGGFYGWNIGSSNTSTNQWVQTALTYSGGPNGTLTLYVNGAAATSTVYSGTPNISSSTASIGRIGTDTSYNFSGLVDDARIYTKALSAADVAKLYTPDPLIKSGTVSINANHNISLDMQSDTFEASLGKNIVFSAGNNITGLSPGKITATRSAGSGGNITMTAGGTGTLDVSKLALDTTGGTVSLTSPGAMTLGSITAGSIIARTTGATSDLTLASGKTLTAFGSGTAITLSSGRNFINNAGSSALSASSGRWLVWSGDPAADTRGSLAYTFKQYNATYGVTSVAGSGNGFLYTLAPTFTVGLTGTVSKVYDGDNTATLSGANYSVSSSAMDGDTVTITKPTSGTYNDKNVNTGKNVAVSGIGIASASNGGATVYGYQVNSTANATIGTITAKGLTITGVTTGNKVYDGNTVDTLGVGSAALSGTVGGDTVTLATGSATGAFANKNVANGKSVTASGFSISGLDAGNYTLSQPVGLTANITPLGLTITGVTAGNKVYDGNTVDTLGVGSAALSGTVGGDTVTLATGSATGAFGDKNVANGKSVTASGFSISGLDVGNYTLAQPLGLTANITPLGLTITGVTAGNKVYDGNTVDTLGVWLCRPVRYSRR